MEGNKNLVSRNRNNIKGTPVKPVIPRVAKNHLIRANCGTAPVRKIHDCLGPTLSRGDTWHTNPQRQRNTEGNEHYSEQSSLVSLSTMTTMNYGNRLNMMATCDPIHGIKFVVREFKLRLKALYPDDEIFYQMISEVGRLVKRVEYGESSPLQGEEIRVKRYVEKVVEKCNECEGFAVIVKQLEENLTSEKEQNKILTAKISDLESQITVKQAENESLFQELHEQKDQVKNLQAAVTDKKLYDDSLLKKFDEYNKKLHDVTQELFFTKLEVDKLGTQLRKKTEIIEGFRSDLLQIQEINGELLELESISGLERKSSTDLSYKSDESFMKFLEFGRDGVCKTVESFVIVKEEN